MAPSSLPQPACSFSPHFSPFPLTAAVPWLGSDGDMLKWEFEELLSFAKLLCQGGMSHFSPPLVLQIPVPD